MKRREKMCCVHSTIYLQRPTIYDDWNRSKNRANFFFSPFAKNIRSIWFWHESCERARSNSVIENEQNHTWSHTASKCVSVCMYRSRLKMLICKINRKGQQFFFLFSPLNLSCYPHWMYGCMYVCVYVALCITLLIRLIQSGPKEVKQLLFMLKACVIWRKTRECMGVFQHKIPIKISNIFWCVICRWSFFLARLISWSDLIGRARGVPINTISIHTFVS